MGERDGECLKIVRFPPLFLSYLATDKRQLPNALAFQILPLIVSFGISHFLIFFSFAVLFLPYRILPFFLLCLQRQLSNLPTHFSLFYDLDYCLSFSTHSFPPSPRSLVSFNITADYVIVLLLLLSHLYHILSLHPSSTPVLFISYPFLLIFSSVSPSTFYPSSFSAAAKFSYPFLF
ncbi:unnamed protein product [Acanthosepion pharaonis]|uniref:Uncharacterized protein n=1 Tax=Acanthosepion pharaonis TaxID=158019 RepID=A0A812DVT5_ACAPH|nr:unnamed protein product [Sepia pharaonis]